MGLIRSITRACRTVIARLRRNETPDSRDDRDPSPLADLYERVKGLGFRSYKAGATILKTCFTTLRQPKCLHMALITSVSVLLAFLITPRAFQPYTPVIGELAQDTVVLPITFKVIDDSATHRSRHEVLKSVWPVYDLDDEMVQDVLSRIAAAFDFMRDYLAAEAAYLRPEADRSHQTRFTTITRSTDSSSFRRLDDSMLRQRFENLLGARLSPGCFALLKSKGFSASIQADLRSLVIPVLLRGVVARRDLPTGDGRQGILLRSKSKDTLTPMRDMSRMFDIKDAISFVNSWKNDPLRDTALSRAIRLMAMDLVNVNVSYNPQKSLSLRQEALVSVKPVYFQVAGGELIIKEGEPVNEGHVKKLAALNKAKPPYSRYMIVTGLTLILAFTFILCFSFAEKYLDRRQNAAEDVVLLSFLLLGTAMMVRLFATLPPLFASIGAGLGGKSFLYCAPVATGAMLAALRMNARIGFVFAALASVAAVLAVGENAYLFLFYFVSGIVGLHGMTRIIDRRSVLKAGALVGMVNIVSLLSIKMASGNLDGLAVVWDLILAFAGGMLSGLLVSAISPLLDPFRHMTNVKLVKLADLNHPLLKQMALEAPATYHHSLMVANLAEAAAVPISANPLLARVGALYHDIGRVDKKANPSQYVEGQARRGNLRTKPGSVATAADPLSHVTRGVKQAKASRLGQPVIDIIQQHHGTNRVELLDKNVSNTEEQDWYRYEGELPQTKESALVMLADAVEAEWRKFRGPTPGSVKKRVQALVLRMFTEGQLDQSTLTLKDLDAITRSFIRTLHGIRNAGTDYSARAARRIPKVRFRGPRANDNQTEPAQPPSPCRFPIGDMAHAATES